MKKVTAIIFSLFVLLAHSCGGPTDRAEKVDRLKGIGLAASPLVQTPSVDAVVKSVDIEVYAAVPATKTVTIAPYQDSPSANAVTVDTTAITIQNNTVAYTDYNGFRVVTFKATVAVPDVKILQAGSPVFVGKQVRYGFEVSTDDDVEYIVGSFLVYPDGAPELSWQNPTIAIDAPTDGYTATKGEKVEIKGSITNLNDENIKYGWYATDGEIANRRAISTLWTAPEEAGTYTIILTARGKKSRGFSIAPISVTVN